MKSKILTVSLMGFITIAICYSANQITSKASAFRPSETSEVSSTFYTDSSGLNSLEPDNTQSSNTPTTEQKKDVTPPSTTPTKKANSTLAPTKDVSPTKEVVKATPTPTKKPTATKAATKKPVASKAPTGPLKVPIIHSVSAPGKVVYTSSDNISYIDASNISKGYIAVKYTGSNKKVKVQIKHNSETYNYDLTTNKTYEYYPLQLGNGTYTVNVLENIAGTKYSILQTETLDVKLSNSNQVFLQPSQYVWFTQSSNVVKVSAEVCHGKTKTIDKISAIFKYVTNNITYDYEKAKAAPVGYLPNVDSIIKSKKGICFDYAAVFAAMCRAQGIPTKLITGYVAPNGVYHAWNEVYSKEKGWITVSFYLKTSGFNIVDPTFYANMDSDESAAKYIGNGSNYKNYHIY